MRTEKSQEKNTDGAKITVERSKRNSVCLKDLGNGTFLLRAPLSYTDEEVAYFLERHKRWLNSRLRNQKSLSLADGERVELFGTDYVIGTGPRAEFRGGALLLPQKKREEALVALMKKGTRLRMEALLCRLSQRYGLGYSALRVSSARGRWGSCSPKKAISISFRTAFLPDALVEYLAAHELCHTLHMDHSAAFWKAVERLCPDWKAKRAALKGYLWAMQVL